MSDDTKRIYKIVKQLYPTTDKPYFVTIQIFMGDRTWYSTIIPGFATLKKAVTHMSSLENQTAKMNENVDK